MAYEEVKKVNVKEFIGLSTDTKPTTDDIGVGSTYYEDDTGLMWQYSKNINPITSNKWWGV